MWEQAREVIEIPKELLSLQKQVQLTRAGLSTNLNSHKLTQQRDDCSAEQRQPKQVHQAQNSQAQQFYLNEEANY